MAREEYCSLPERNTEEIQPSARVKKLVWKKHLLYIQQEIFVYSKITIVMEIAKITAGYIAIS